MVKVYQAINKVQSDLSAIGISKSNRNAQQGYNFRGIDDVLNALSPLLARNGLCILPRVMSRQCEERANAKGTVLFYVTVDMEFDFVSAEDGSKHTIRTVGEAMDSGDKATNKAQSAAMKYACILAFAIPTVGDNDADATTHEDIQRRGSPRQAPTPAPRPALQPLTEEASAAVKYALESWAAGDKDAVARSVKEVPAAEKTLAVQHIRASAGGNEMLAYLASLNAKKEG